MNMNSPYGYINYPYQYGIPNKPFGMIICSYGGYNQYYMNQPIIFKSKFHSTTTTTTTINNIILFLNFIFFLIII